jgi:hypothetical protein
VCPPLKHISPFLGYFLLYLLAISTSIPISRISYFIPKSISFNTATYIYHGYQWSGILCWPRNCWFLREDSNNSLSIHISPICCLYIECGGNFLVFLQLSGGSRVVPGGATRNCDFCWSLSMRVKQAPQTGHSCFTKFPPFSRLCRLRLLTVENSRLLRPWSQHWGLPCWLQCPGPPETSSWPII